MFKSENGGETWTTSDLQGALFPDLYVQTRDPETLYVPATLIGVEAMRINSIEAVRLEIPQSAPPSTSLSAASITSPQYALGHPGGRTRTAPRRPSWSEEAEVANPMSRYPKVKQHRSQWLPGWSAVWCKVSLEDGTWGVGCTGHGRAVAAVIDDHLAAACIRGRRNRDEGDQSEHTHRVETRDRRHESLQWDR